jgi:hypothetical protein
MFNFKDNFKLRLNDKFWGSVSVENLNLMFIIIV